MNYIRKVDKSNIPTCNIMGVNIAAINMEWLKQYLKDNLKDLKGDYICVSNVHTTVTSYEDENYRNIQNNALMAIPDGGPLSSIGRKRGFSSMDRTSIDSWCNEKKVNCKITDEYSDTVAKGSFVSQSVSANTTIYEGDIINIVYSLGKEPTISQKNALKSAKSYLSFSAFSYNGLIKQLEYEEYSHEDAVYAVDNCSADWNEQAVKSAKSYLSFSSFSKNGLIKQLEYEGFTHEQAVYGAEQNGL